MGDVDYNCRDLEEVLEAFQPPGAGGNQSGAKEEGQQIEDSTPAVVNEEVDSQMVVDRQNRGFQPPGDIPFIDLSDLKNNGELTGDGSNGQPNNRMNGYSGGGSGGGTGSSLKLDNQSLTYKGTMSGGKNKKRSGLFGIFRNQKAGEKGERDDYSDLSPNQRRKKLQEKVDKCAAGILQETAAKDELLKMQAVYQSNPDLGDPAAIVSLLRENTRNVVGLQQELQKYSTYLNEMEAELGGGACGYTPQQNNYPNEIDLTQGQYDNVIQHTEPMGIEVLDRYGHFLRDRANIEVEYAGRLRKLVKTYQPKKKGDDDFQFTSCKAFKDMLNEINDRAEQHELIPKHLVAPVKDANKYSNQLGNLERSKRNYEKSFRESEKALEAFKRADADLNLSRAEVENQRLESLYKSQQYEESKKEYTNQFLKLHPIARAYLPNVPKAAADVNEGEDCQMVVDRREGGFLPFEDIPFVDLSDLKNNGELTGDGSNGQPNNRMNGYSGGGSGGGTGSSLMLDNQSLTYKGTMSGGKNKKRSGLFGIFGNQKAGEKEELSSTQRREMVAELTARIRRYNEAKDALSRMQGMDDNYPGLLHPKDADLQMQWYTCRVRELKQELLMHRPYLNHTEGTQEPHWPMELRGALKSYTPTDVPISVTQGDTLGVVVPDKEEKWTIVKKRNGVIGMVPSSVLTTPFVRPNQPNYYEEPLPVLGTCEALYPFKATYAAGCISMCVGETLSVVELDQGDGWTRVRRQNSMEEGFVPTSYVKILQLLGTEEEQ